ncbi:hypothetical protein [Sinorhizobium meliloti]
MRDTYPKTEETFSLKTSDHKEALRRLPRAMGRSPGAFRRAPQNARSAARASIAGADTGTAQTHRGRVLLAPAG